MRTRVFITIDTEFSIGGTFDNPDVRTPIGVQNVLGMVDGVSQGLGFMLDTFRAHGIPATFFIETMQTAFFGDEPMRDLALHISGEGHDAELHLHPVWTYFDRADWREHLSRQRPNDDLHGRSVDELVSWMQRGIDTFRRWGLPAPVALRTGNLMVDRNVYRAMAKAGIPVASNVARAVFEPEECELRLNAGVHRIEGIVELPVLTYVGLRFGARKELKSLTIAGSSVDETIHVLQCAHREQVGSVVVLTHCHEFVKGDMHGALKIDRVNQSRLSALCDFLRCNVDCFEASTMRHMVAARTASPADPLFQVPTRAAIRRIVQNKLSDHDVI
jgi:hypothetical protein